jgi:hypothetical protein
MPFAGGPTHTAAELEAAFCGVAPPERKLEILDAIEPLNSVPVDGLTALEYGTQFCTHAMEVVSGKTDWSEHQIAEMLTRMNNEHAVVALPNGTVRYAHFTKNAEGNNEIRLLKKEDFEQRYAPVRFKYAGKHKSAANAWMDWPKRRQYDGSGFFPGSDVCPPKVPKGYLNLFRGYTIRPKEGDWSLLRSHLFNCVCGKDHKLFD